MNTHHIDNEKKICDIRKSITTIDSFPLYNQMFSDPYVKFCFRGIDLNWKYNSIFPQVQCGFNPFNSTIYFSNKSAFSDWFFSKDRDLSQYGTNDYVVFELLFGIHDYLHVWTYHCLDHLTNGRFGELTSKSTPLTDEEIDEMVFFHLTSEAVATIGLDYWYLPRVELRKTLSIGTFISNLTSSFTEKHMDEFHKFNPDFNPFRASFLKEMTLFYCSGEFEGFDLEALRRSNIVFRWLRHEIGYGQTQRNYSYTWMKYLFSDCTDYVVNADSTTYVPFPEKYHSVIDKLGEMLWDKVTGKNDHFIKGSLKGGQTPKFRKILDPKFSNPLTQLYNIKNNEELAHYELMQIVANRQLNFEDTSMFNFFKSFFRTFPKDHPLTKSQVEFLLRDLPLVETVGEDPEAIFVLP